MPNYEEESNVDSRGFRRVMGLFATGVTVVTTDLDGQTYGMTANAVTSVSLDPLLVLICVQKDATWGAYLEQVGGFAINILGEDQEEISNFFAGLWPDDAAPPGFEFETWNGGARLQSAIGGVACETEQFVDGGDHWIVIGRVVDLFWSEPADNPLLFYGGQYRRLRP